MTDETTTGETPDPQTAERARTHEAFEKSMDEQGLLQEDGGVALEPEDVEHETPPGAEQAAG